MAHTYSFLSDFFFTPTKLIDVLQLANYLLLLWK
jgi:hypothetical protein